MSDCKICFRKGEGKFMSRSAEGDCPVCNPEQPIEQAKDACVYPPLGEPTRNKSNYSTPIYTYYV